MKETSNGSQLPPTEEILRLCTNCGHKVEDGANLCSRCGRYLRAGEAQEQISRWFRSMVGKVHSRSNQRFWFILAIIVIAAIVILIAAVYKQNNQNNPSSAQQQGNSSAPTNNLERFLPAQVGDFKRVYIRRLPPGTTEAPYQRPNGDAIDVSLDAFSSQEQALQHAQTEGLEEKEKNRQQIQELSDNKPAIFVERPDNDTTGEEIQAGLLPSDKTVAFEVSNIGGIQDPNTNMYHLTSPSDSQDVEDFMRSWECQGLRGLLGLCS